MMMSVATRSYMYSICPTNKGGVTAENELIHSTISFAKTREPQDAQIRSQSSSVDTSSPQQTAQEDMVP